MVGQVEAQTIDKEVVYEVVDATRRYEVGRSKTYDYSPSVIDENGIRSVYVCGGGTPGSSLEGHDAIYLTQFNLSTGVKIRDSQRVLTPLLGRTGADGLHACAPSVIRHSFSAIDNGKEKYLMYYECAPHAYNKDSGQDVSPFTQICVAYSDDGLSWKKYSEQIWNSQYRFANENEPPTPVVKINQELVSKIGVTFSNNTYYVNITPAQLDVNYYGVGHPSAIKGPDGKIWLYYYDSVATWGARGIFLAKSDDGFHFSEPVKINNLRSPGDIKYINKQIAGHEGVYIWITNGYYNYSWNGINWFWNEIDQESFYSGYLTQNFKMLPVAEGKCLSPGGMSLAADKFGRIDNWGVELFTNEGGFGKYDGCSSTNGCACFNAEEEKGRGYTWQTYGVKAKFGASMTGPTLEPTIKPTDIVVLGDANGDAKVNLADFVVWKKEYLKLVNTKTADFSKNGTVGLEDFVTWKKGYLGL